MEITGTIVKVMPLTSGVSKSTGNAWAKQEYVLDLMQHYTGGTSFPRQERIVFSVFGQDKIAEFGLTEMETVTVSVEFSAREYNGRWYNDIRAWHVQRKVEQDPVVQAAVPTQEAAWDVPFQAPQSAANLFGWLEDVRAAAVENEPHADDLPF